jgi:hypothetical protein
MATAASTLSASSINRQQQSTAIGCRMARNSTWHMLVHQHQQFSKVGRLLSAGCSKSYSIQAPDACHLSILGQNARLLSEQQQALRGLAVAQQCWRASLLRQHLKANIFTTALTSKQNQTHIVSQNNSSVHCQYHERLH